MTSLSIRELRRALTKIEDILAREGEVVITRHGRAVAKLVDMGERPRPTDRAALRARAPKSSVPSEVLLREERDES